MPDLPFSLSSGTPALHWVKADLHLHTAEDPCDDIDYTAQELLTRAHAEGFRVLAITLHDKVFDDPEVFARAEALGILLIPAAELRLEGSDAVILNLSREEATRVRTFADLRRLRAERSVSLLVFAPHPYYRLGGSIGHRIEGYLDCFDAIEHCHFHVPFLNPNRSAARLAIRTGKPLLATSDAHRLRFFSHHYSHLGLETPPDQTPTVEAVFAAIRAHRLRLVKPTGGWSRFLALMFFLFCIDPLLKRLPGSKRSQARRAAATSQTPHPTTDEQALVRPSL